MQTRHDRGARTAFAGDQLVLAVRKATHDRRLDDPVGTDRIAKLLERILIEVGARLPRATLDVERHDLHHSTSRLRGGHGRRHGDRPIENIDGRRLGRRRTEERTHATAERTGAADAEPPLLDLLTRRRLAAGRLLQERTRFLLHLITLYQLSTLNSQPSTDHSSLMKMLRNSSGSP